jgi:hypothetical protein
LGSFIGDFIKKTVFVDMQANLLVRIRDEDVSMRTVSLKAKNNQKSNNSRVEAGSNTSTVALRLVGGDEKETQCLGV